MTEKMLPMRPKVTIGSKSPSPKLLINHGKPNFTINRSKSAGIDRSFSFCGNTSGNPALNGRDYRLKTINRQNRKGFSYEESGDNNELMEKFQKIKDKLDIIEKTKDQSASSSYKTDTFETTSKSPTQEFHKEELVKLKVTNGHTNGHTNGSVDELDYHYSNNSFNGHNNTTNSNKKPVLPKKPEHLQLLKTPSPSVASQKFFEVTSPLNSGAPFYSKKSISTMNSENNNNNNNNFKNSHEKIDTNTRSNGMNFETKTVVSFSRDLSTGPNKYPDTVKVLKTAKSISDNETEENSKENEMFKELTKLKFDITDNGEMITPILRDSS